MDPNEIFRSLAEEGVEYVLIGGLAATVHGVSLVTQDTDICFRQSPENCERPSTNLSKPRPLSISPKTASTSTNSSRSEIFGRSREEQMVDDEKRPEQEIALAWAREAERRSQEMDETEDEGIPAEEVFRHLFAEPTVPNLDLQKAPEGGDGV